MSFGSFGLHGICAFNCRIWVESELASGGTRRGEDRTASPVNTPVRPRNAILLMLNGCDAVPW